MLIPKRWSFSSEEVAKDFDNHVKSELPWYELATWAVSTMGSHFIPENGIVYDIGASTGNIGKALSEVISQRNASLIAIDSEKSMQSEYEGGGAFVLADAMSYEYQDFDFCVLFLSLMFMPVHSRASLVRRLVSKMNKGGCIVIFDKCDPLSGFLSTAIYRMTLEAKINAGVSADNVINKELSLQGVQRPLMSDELPGSAVEIFRFGDFAGWVITK